MKNAIVILIAIFLSVGTCQAQDITVQPTDYNLTILGALDSSEVIKAQKKFRKRYSSEGKIDTTNILIRVDDKLAELCKYQSDGSVNGLVFHYLVGEDGISVEYLVGLGYSEGSSLISHQPFPSQDNNGSPYYLLFEQGTLESYRVIPAEGREGEIHISDTVLNSLHTEYDSLMNRRNWFWIIKRDVENIKRHPNMIHYPFEELNEFYKEYYEKFEYYTRDQKKENAGEPELYLFISTGAYHGGNRIDRRFHSPILRFGTEHGAFAIKDTTGRKYLHKAFDVGVLCPPNCPSTIWPANF